LAHLVLLATLGHLHATGGAKAGVWHVTVAADLVAGVDNNDATVQVVGERATGLADCGGFANAGTTKEENGAAVGDLLLGEAGAAGNSATSAAR